MIPEWPTDLPRPLRDGFSSQRADARRRRQFETGPPRYQRRFSAVPVTHAMSLIADPAQIASLDRFFVETLQEGAVPFWMPDVTSDGRSVLEASGLPLVTEAGASLLLTRRILCVWGENPPHLGAFKGIGRTVEFSVVEMP